MNLEWLDKSTKLTPYIGSVWRVVEDQETKATLNIVDSMSEQLLLEELLDEVKPPYRDGTQKMHYLLKSAFRYPPLIWGSRFGTQLMPSFFYASERVQTALCETAFYRFVFLDDMSEPFDKPINSSYTVFSATVKSERCLDLVDEACNSIHFDLVKSDNYPLCQRIGKWAVEECSADLIRYESVRRRSSVNVAIAEPKAIRSNKPKTTQSWLCQTQGDSISFSSRYPQQMHSFDRSQFLENGKLPRPA